ncbi:hypothetical protein SAMN05421753_120104 [Planctomicrobium piriforme]|uniref:Uncharacterized protein n=1 Tax=Planctomicrobium piriforme TaxID=1576369 RepID=A0A1I3RFA0_9PLAN|nr:hypothetical protein SAMN05421753_120104 [Planctomicrobium piriforme]
MCYDAHVQDLVPSRVRWYDIPGLFFFRNAIRCRLCDDRYFVRRVGKVDQAVRKIRFGEEARVH